MKNINLNEIRDTLQKFADEREWGKYHSPKNLSMALAKESAELLELFQWKTDEESYHIEDISRHREKIEDEVADIALYLILLSSKLDIDIGSAIENKMIKNARKYPVEKARGNAKKYTDF